MFFRIPKVFFILPLSLIFAPPLALLQGGEQAADPALELRAPAGNRPVEVDPAGETVLPNGRLITPLGKHVKVAPHPYGLTQSPDGKTLVTVNNGTHPFSVSIISGLESADPQVVQIPPGFKDSNAEPDSVNIGAAVAPDNRTLYLSEGNNGRIGIYDLLTHRRLDSITLDGAFQGKTYKHSLTGEMRLSPDGKRLYVLDLAHFRLVTLDPQSKQVLSSLTVGRFPFGLALSPDGRRVYVSNVGMFQYSLVPGFDPKDPKMTGLDFPPFGFPSKEAEEGVTVEGRKIPGLGSPNTPESNSLWVIDVSNPAELRVLEKIRTGLPVGENSVGGSSPGAVVAGRRKIFVSNAGQDSLSVVDARSMRLRKTVVLEPAPAVRGLRGVLPFGLALSPDEKRLYVACAGINAVAVLDARKEKVLGYLPAAWFPARVEISRDGKTLYVSNAKGFGAGPNGGPKFQPGPEGTFIGDITKGVVAIFSVPDGRALKSLTEQVLRNNGFVPSSAANSRRPDFPIPPPGQPSAKIHHVIFIVKENRTFDQVFGDVPSIGGARVEAEPSLADYGDDAEVKQEGGGRIEHVRVTPNHHALFARFASSDNFFVDSDVSIDGHHWLIGNYPNELIEALWPAAYGHRLDFEPDPDAPGRLEVDGTFWPETYVEAGTIWHHLARHHVTFRNYGESLDLPGSRYSESYLPTGIRESLNAPLPEVLFEATSRAFATFNLTISDQYRFSQFQSEFRVRYLSGREPLPQFIFIWLSNDHTANPRPEDGFPFRASYVADNDLALGKLVELLSHSPFWKDLAIFVTEDDAQDGRDHVDAHRSFVMAVSPYARRGVSHVHTSITSILKTFDLIFGIPYLNQYDAAATDLADLFTDEPDFSPYDALPSDTRIFDPAKVVEPGHALHARPGQPSEPLDDPETIRRHHRELQQQREED